MFSTRVRRTFNAYANVRRDTWPAPQRHGCFRRWLRFHSNLVASVRTTPVATATLRPPHLALTTAPGAQATSHDGYDNRRCTCCAQAKPSHDKPESWAKYALIGRQPKSYTDVAAAGAGARVVGSLPPRGGANL